MANAGDYQVADGDDDDDGWACQLICVPSYSRLSVHMGESKVKHSLAQNRTARPAWIATPNETLNQLTCEWVLQMYIQINTFCMQTRIEFDLFGLMDFANHDHMFFTLSLSLSLHLNWKRTWGILKNTKCYSICIH